MLRVKQGPKVNFSELMMYHKQGQHTLSLITSLFHFNCHHISVCIYRSTKHVTWHQAFLCVVMWHTHHPSWPLLPLTAPSNVETMATASWNQFVTHSLHFVWSVRQSSGAAVGENGAQASGASNFSKWGQAVDNHTATSCMTPVRPLASAKLERNLKLQ